MFYSGRWYANSQLNRQLLHEKLNELATHQTELERTLTLIPNGPCDTDDDDGTKLIVATKQELIKVSATIAILRKAIKGMGYNMPKSNTNNDDLRGNMPINQIEQIRYTLHSNYYHRTETECEYDKIQLHTEYETALLHFDHKTKLLRADSIEHQVFHVAPLLSPEERDKKNVILKPYGKWLYVKHIWVATLDDVFSEYTNKDIVELEEGQHIWTGNIKLFGKLTIRGHALSGKPSKSSLLCTHNSIWCVGLHTKIELIDLCISPYPKSLNHGLLRLSLNASCLATNCDFHCNEYEGIAIEYGAKLLLEQCLIEKSVGAGIHMNRAAKCMLINSQIKECGGGSGKDYGGQGAIVIYGTEINYAQHLCRQLPSLRFPVDSMDNVPTMVMKPDPKLAAMLRGKLYLYLSKCKLTDNKGFGISFEISKHFDPLKLADIANMIDASITVRDTLFAGNSFVNIGKIPGHWIDIVKNKNEEELNERVKKINPILFSPAITDKTEKKV
eukprot:102365_1